MAKCKLIRSSIPAKITCENMHLAWQNPNPAQPFPATEADRTITLDTDGDYDFLMIECRLATSADRAMMFMGSKSAPVIIASMPTIVNPSPIQSGVFTRNIIKVSDTQYTFEDAYKTWYSTSSVDNSLCIPQKIYTFKKTLTAEVTAIASSVKTNAQNCMMSNGVTSVEDALNYSTTEHAVGKWIDGSTLYEKTIDCGALPNATTKSVAHGISNIDKILDVKGIAIRSGAFKPIPYIWNTTHIDVEATDVYVYLNTSSDMSSYTNTYVTVRYTKTS